MAHKELERMIIWKIEIGKALFDLIDPFVWKCKKLHLLIKMHSWHPPIKRRQKMFCRKAWNTHFYISIHWKVPMFLQEQNV